MNTEVPGNKKSANFKVDTTNYNDNNAAFSFKGKGHVFCLSKCQMCDKAAVADRLQSLGQMTWNDISRLPKETYGFEMIPVKQLKVKLPSIVTKDVKKVMVFRFTDSGRLAGIRERDIFNIIFVAPNHDLY